MEPSSCSSALSYPPDLHPPQQIVVHLHQGSRRMTDNRVYPDYKGKTSITLGVVQIFFALTAVACNALGWWEFDVVVQDYNKDMAEGHDYFYEPENYMMNAFTPSLAYWTSPLFLLCGVMAIVAAKKKSHRKLRAVLGLAITCALLGLALFGWSFYLIVFNISQIEIFDSGNSQFICALSIILSVSMMACGLVETILSVWLSTLAGSFVACSKAPLMDETPSYVQVPTQPQQPTVLTDAQMQLVNGFLQGNNLVAGGAHHHAPIAQTHVVTLPQGQETDGRNNNGFENTSSTN